MKLKLILRNTKRSSNLPTKVFRKQRVVLGTAIYNPQKSALELPLEIDIKDFAALSEDLTRAAEDPSMHSWYIADIEAMDNATERESETADQLDAAVTELEQRRKEAQDLQNIAAERLGEATTFRAKSDEYDALFRQMRKPEGARVPITKMYSMEELPIGSNGTDHIIIRMTVQPDSHPSVEGENTGPVEAHGTAEQQPAAEDEENEEDGEGGGDHQHEGEHTEESLRNAGGVRGLRKIAKGMQVPGYRKLNKEEDLIDAILAHQAAQQPPAAE